MFNKEVYQLRRANLRTQLNSGLILMLANQDMPINYKQNPYNYRQDSNFSYFFGLDNSQYNGLIDIDSGISYAGGPPSEDEDDGIWSSPEMRYTHQQVLDYTGVGQVIKPTEFESIIKDAIAQSRKIHFLPPYRDGQKLQLKALLGIDEKEIENYVSVEMIEAVVNLRSIKEDREIVEIEKAMSTAYDMHTKAMRMTRNGIKERDVMGKIEGISLMQGWGTSFQIICTVDGQYLHNHYYGNTLEDGKLLLTDAGAETLLHYASDITRTIPVSGTFDNRQKDIYNIVLSASETSINAIQPGVLFKDIHLLACEIIAQGLKGLGIMKGDIQEAVRQGAHALFFPHGLGHQMGLDVHDMEGLGEDYVGYNDSVKRSTQFGLAYLRMAKSLKSGNVLTVEPGIYFIPALIDKWKAEGKFTEFIDYDVAETYKDFGGVRIEDDILVTATGFRLLGQPIPKTVQEIETYMANN